MIISCSVLLRIRILPDWSCREIKTHFMLNNVFPKIVTFMRYVENVVEDNITRSMRIAWKINKAACTARICKTYCFPVPTVVTRTHLTITFIGILSVFLNLIWFACFKQASSSTTCILGAFANLRNETSASPYPCLYICTLIPLDRFIYFVQLL